MDKKIKRRWLRALRSGKYTQCKGSLHIKDDGFCCLGVLCDILRKDFDNVKWRDSGYHPNGDDDDEECEIFQRTAVLPIEIMKYAKLCDRESYVEIVSPKDNESKVSLAELNDEGWTFEEIADVIAKQL